MSASRAPGTLNLEQLLEAIDRLAPAQRRELERRLAARRVEDGNEVSDEATPIRAAGFRLSAAAERRLKRLIDRSERGLLTPEELVEYRALAQEAQQLDVAHAEALAEQDRLGKSARPTEGGTRGRGRRNGS